MHYSPLKGWDPLNKWHRVTSQNTWNLVTRYIL